MNWEYSIENDRIQKVNENFYENIRYKMNNKQQRPSEFGNVFLKRHLWMSLAAGIILGLLINGIYHYQMNHDHKTVLKEWMECHYIDDINIEHHDYHVF